MLQDPRAELPLARLFFRPHVMFSADARLLAAAALWAFVWLAALLPPGGWRRFLLFWGIALFAVAAISVSVSVAEELIERGGEIHAQA